jgi:transmembrane sensor
MIVAGPAGYLAWRAAPWPEWTADVRTATGERRELQLPDSSRMQLDTGSAVDIAFTATERRLVLRAGAIAVATAPDATRRPFLVQTPHGTALALGTRYTARLLDEDSTLVVVRQGVVELRAAAGGEAVLVTAGQQARMGRSGAAPARSATLASDGWTQGVLYAEGMPLGEFVAELARYRPGIVRCDPAVARLTVSGAFQLRDTDQALLALAASLPVRISMRTRYWVHIAALGPAS